MRLRRWPKFKLYNRYTQLVPMSADEREVTPELKPSMAAKIPHAVHEQLSTDFLPAAKNIGQAGMKLMKSYAVFQESLSEYCAATHRLIKSADSAGTKAKHEVQELATVFKEFVKGVTAHEKIIHDFNVLAEKVHDYSVKDKEKMNREFEQFKKEEKKILKKKGGETDQDIANFYRKNATDWSRQQELRYKFFNDNLHAWINNYAQMARMLLGEPAVATTVVAPATPKVEHVVPHVEVAPPVNNWHDEIHEHTAAVVAKENEDKNHDASAEIALGDRKETRTDSSSSYATTVEGVATDRKPTFEPSGVQLVSTNKRGSMDVSTYDLETRNHYTPIIQAPPPLPTRPSARSDTHTSAPAYVQNDAYVAVGFPEAAPRTNDYANQNDRYAQIQRNNSFHRTQEEYPHRHSVVSSAVPDQPRVSAPGVTRSGRMIPGAVPVLAFAQNNNSQPQMRYTPAQPNNNAYQVVTSDHIRVGRVVENPITEEQMNAKKFHVDANYVSLSAPSHQPLNAKKTSENGDINVPSYFNPSQYGSILIVNDDFNASSGEQMTVNRGDKVILLKCGSRGWVFVRDSISNRTGWVPEPYVNP